MSGVWKKAGTKTPLPSSRQRCFCVAEANAGSVARMALGAREGINVLVVVLARIARHLQFSPDRPGEIRGLSGEFAAFGFFEQVLLHGSLLSEKITTQREYVNRSY